MGPQLYKPYTWLSLFHHGWKMWWPQISTSWIHRIALFFSPKRSTVDAFQKFQSTHASDGRPTHFSTKIGWASFVVRKKYEEITSERRVDGNLQEHQVRCQSYPISWWTWSENYNWRSAFTDEICDEFMINLLLLDEQSAMWCGAL